MPYPGVPAELTSKMERCVQRVMAQGHNKSSAIAICHKSIVGKKEESATNPVMVAFAIPPEIGKQLLASVQSSLPANSNIISLDQLHLTLAFLGESNEVGKTKDFVASVVQGFASPRAPIGGKVSGVGLFTDLGDENQSCLYASFDSPDLPDFQKDLVDTLVAYGIPVSEEHGFDPHITLAYMPDPSNLAKFQVPNLSIVFSSIVLAWGGDWTSAPLVQDTQVATDSGSPMMMGWAAKIL